MQHDQGGQIGRRVLVAFIGSIFLTLAILAGVALHTGGWRWWLALLCAVCVLEALDFFIAATRRRGVWPAGANLLLDVFLP